MDNNKQKNNIILVTLLSAFFGLVAGSVGGVFSSGYFSNFSGLPFFGEINFPSNYYNGQGLVIRGAKKVVVEQDMKTIDTIKSVSEGIVGIFPKTQSEENDKLSDEYYILNKEIAQGLIITSDGWIVSSDIPQEINSKNISNYIVVTKDKKKLNIDNLIRDDKTLLSFLHIENIKDLTVNQFLENKDVNDGQSVIILGWGGGPSISNIYEKSAGQDLKASSEQYYYKYTVSGQTDKIKVGAVAVDLSGNIVGVVNKEKKIEPISHIKPVINALFKGNDVIRPYFGISYLNLSGVLSKSSGDLKGVLVYDLNGQAVAKNSPAEKAGIKNGDILTSINNIVLDANNNLSEILLEIEIGTEVNIGYVRNGESKTTTAVLSPEVK